MDNSIKKILFLGPKGTYSQFALEKFKDKLGLNIDTEAVSTIPKIIDLVDKDNTLAAVVPIENSIEGIVRGTLDSIYASQNDVKILAQTQIGIENCLISNCEKKDIKRIISHPQPLSQCQNYISRNFGKNIELINASSTAAAVESLSDEDKNTAAIGSEFCANLYGVRVLEKNINDNKDNKTRFVFISQIQKDFGSKTRTSIVFSTKQEPGALVVALEVFKKHNLNLIYIESRPSKRVLGEYNFFVDIDKGIEDIEKALEELGSRTQYYRVLGSYPVI